MKNINRDSKLRRKRRTKRNIVGLAEKPRISVFRSNRHIYAQAIDDEKRITLASYSSQNLKKDNPQFTNQKMTKTQIAKLVGLNLAKILIKKNIKKGIFYRRNYAYGGRIKALVEGLREGGIII